MSRLWRDRLVLAIYPDHVAWLHATGSLHPRVIAKDMVSCAVDKASSWRGAFSLLPDILHAVRTDRMRVTAMLSNRLLRYAIVPNPDSARSREELDKLTRHAFERAHGDAVAGWDIRLSDAAPGHPALACAVDRELIVALRNTVATSGARLTSIQPYLMAAFNRLDRALRTPDGIFVLAEPERLSLLAWKQAGWCGVQQVHATDDWVGSLYGIVDRLTITAGLHDHYSLRLCAPELAGGESVDCVSAANDWKVEMAVPAWPPGLTPIQDRIFAGAMLALS
ncbi:hypothetical protein [Nitrosospira sp. NpAV]|uniref:hypothetical protein n=1 Tax=Nitrosospira sp. NpAV TaxID=58133 RepID=UPI00069766B7|nr:hypothetical protein [Nitrosospira sp. NpAV]